MIHKISLLLYVLFSIPIAFSCPHIEGEYICGPNSTPLKVTQSPEGDFYRYEFQYLHQKPKSGLTDNISHPDPDDPSFFYTVRCVGSVLGWTTTPIPLNPEEKGLALEEQANIRERTTTPPNTEGKDLLDEERINVLLETKLSEGPYRSVSITNFYYPGENGILEERTLTIMPQFQVTSNNSIGLSSSLKSLVARTLRFGLLGLSSEEMSERIAAEMVKIKQLPEKILNEYRTCEPIGWNGG